MWFCKKKAIFQQHLECYIYVVQCVKTLRLSLNYLMGVEMDVKVIAMN